MLTKLRYQLDLTGELPENRVEHKVTIGASTDRSFALPTGPFFTDNLTIIDSAKPQTPLDRGKDFEVVYLYSKLTKMSRGKEICGVIVIINPEVSTDLVVKANVVGSEYVNQYELLTRVIEDLGLDKREVEFWRIEGVPQQWEAAPHLQDLGDIFGFEYIISIMAELVSIVSAGATPELESIITGMSGIESRLKAMIQAHIDSEGNVHNANPHQVGTYTSTEIDTFLNNFRNSVNTVTERLGQMENKDKVLNDKLISIETLFRQHVGTLAAIREDLSAAEAQFSGIHTELARLKKVDEDQQVQLDAVKQDLARNWADQAKMLEDLTAEINSTEEQLLNVIRDNVNTLIARIMLTEAKDVELNGYLDQLEEELKQHAILLSGLRRDVNSNDDDITGLRNDIAGLRNVDTNHQNQLNDVKSQIASNDGDIAALQRNITTINNVLADKQNQLDAIKQDLARNWSDQADLLNKINVNIAEIAKLKQKDATHDSRLSTIESKHNALRREYDARCAWVNNQLNAINNRHNELLARYNREIPAFSDRVDAVEEDLVKIKEDIQSLVGNDSDFNGVLNDFATRIAALEKEEAEKWNDQSAIRLHYPQYVSGGPGWRDNPDGIWHNKTNKSGNVVTSTAALANGLQVRVRAYYVGNSYVAATAYTAGYWANSRLERIEVAPLNASGKFVAVDGTYVSEQALRTDRAPQFSTMNIYSLYATIFFKKK